MKPRADASPENVSRRETTMGRTTFPNFHSPAYGARAFFEVLPYTVEMRRHYSSDPWEPWIHVGSLDEATRTAEIVGVFYDVRIIHDTIDDSNVTLSIGISI